jgi:hypothetical protein
MSRIIVTDLNVDIKILLVNGYGGWSIKARLGIYLLVQAFLLQLTIIFVPLSTTPRLKLELVAHVIPWRCCSPHVRHGQRPRAP